MSSSSSTTTTLTDADMEPVRNFLNTALQGKQNGQPAPYHIIVQQFRVRDDPETLWKVVIALNSFASLLTSRAEMYKELLSAIFTYDWRGELRLTKAILDLTVNLVSTNAIYVTSALELVVQYFVPTFNSLAKEIANDSNRNETLQYIHHIIQKIIQQTPTGQNLLHKILKSSFPHKRFSRIEHTEYVNQLLLICDYLPSLEYRILHLIITNCLEMDVEIIIEDTGDVRIQREYEQDYYEEEIFQLDEGFGGENNGGLTSTTIGGGGGTGAGGAAGTNRIPAEVADLADKLDCMLYLLVNYLDKQMMKFQQENNNNNSTTTNNDNAVPATPATKTSSIPSTSSSSSSKPAVNPLEQKFYQHILQIFEHNLLSAFKSKFTQFLIFYLAGKSAMFTELFIQQLVRIGLYSPMASSIKRQSAMMYLASFLSRANFVPLSCINDTLSEMLIWSTYYVNQYHAETILDLPSVIFEHLTSQLLAKTTTLAAVTSSSSATVVATTTSHAEKKINTPEELHAQMTTYLGYFQSQQQQHQQSSQHQQQQQQAPSSSSCLSVASSMTGWTSTSNSTNAMGMDLFIDHIDYDDYGRMYIKEHTVGQHELFYAIVQSLCYTLCFYGLPLTTLQQQSPYIIYYWNYLFVSRFDPLRYCLKTVKNEFLQLAKVIGLFDEKVWECFAPELLVINENDNDSVHTAYPIWQPPLLTLAQPEEGGLIDELLQLIGQEITATTAIVTAVTSNGTAMTTNTTNNNNNNYFRKSLGPNTLESFFPFDPCYLVKMHSCIESLYRSWQGVPGVDDDLLYPHNVTHGRTYEHLPGQMISDSEVTSTTSHSHSNANSIASSSLLLPGGSYLSSATFLEESYLSSQYHPETDDDEVEAGHITSQPTNTTATTTMLSSSLRIAETEIDNYDAMLQEETWRLRQSSSITTASATATASATIAAKKATNPLTMTNLSQLNAQYFTSYSASADQLLHHKSPIALHMAMSPATNEMEDLPMRRRPRLYSIGSTGSW